MFIPAAYFPAAYSLTAMGIWGASDFLGGVGARRANAFLFTAVGHLSGVVLMGLVALLTRAPFRGGRACFGASLQGRREAARWRYSIGRWRAGKWD